MNMMSLMKQINYLHIIKYDIHDNPDQDSVYFWTARKDRPGTSREHIHQHLRSSFLCDVL